MSLFSKSKVSEELKNKEIQVNIDDGTLLNKEGYNKGIDAENSKKESIWNRDIKLQDLKFKRIKKVDDSKPAKPKSIRLVSLDIGSSDIKIVEGQVKGGKLKIYNMRKIKSPEEIIQDGELFNEESILLKLKEEMKTSRVRTKNIALVSSSSTIISREIIVPYVENNEELKTLVNYEIEQFLAINLNNYVIQFMRLEEVIVDEVRKEKIFTIIYPKNLIESYRNLAEKLLLNPYALDISNNSIRKLSSIADIYNVDLINKEESILYLDLGYKSVDLSIVNNNNLEFIRVMPIGGIEIDRFIADLNGISMEEAEEIKKAQVEVGKHRKENQLNDGVVEVIEGWLEDLNRIIQFYTNKSNGKKISHIYLYGGTSKLRGIDEYIALKTGIDTTKIITANNIEFSKNVNTTTIEEYVNALGALVRL
ncbi:pilus assembly protein PilM [Clostridium sp. UBA7791]|uniref:pilus assembly protein PilM n=1 Tax=Clostridium sp. UBA7791 TaxID=1946379 RepID=UPI0032168C5D